MDGWVIVYAVPEEKGVQLVLDEEACMGEKIAIIGLGYVGLPVALAFAKVFPNTVGFDIDANRIAELVRNVDRTGEVESEALENSAIIFTTDTEALVGTTLFIVAVPTPIDVNRNPDLRPIRSASKTVAQALEAGALVVYESTVYPGVTEDICGPILEEVSGLRRGQDFKLGYSPERINPGDKEHTLEKIIKVVSAEDEASLERVASAYGAIIEAGVYKAPSIKVAEAAKVIENTQRDLNISLMNELALIFDRLNICTRDVLEAASTKWNFLPFSPGLVGGHCIGVDPYYLTSKAEEVGYYPQVILAGRHINDAMGAFIAQKLIKFLAKTEGAIKRARVGILGLTFKENVPDLRNSRVPDIIEELRGFGIEPLVHDPFADKAEAEREHGVTLAEWSKLENLDAIILAVAHDAYLELLHNDLSRVLGANGIIIDVKSALRSFSLPEAMTYWSL